MATQKTNPKPSAKSAAARKPPTYGKPEQKKIMPMVLGWGFVAIAALAIIWMVAANPREKKMVCTPPPGGSSLIGFGTCTEE